MEVIEDKKQQIISAAIRRFSHFGIFKTSMSEIADDVALSKANLYYYFPDKWTLIESIVEGFQMAANAEIEKIFEKFSGTEDRLMHLMDFQFEYVSKYKMLFHNIQEFHSAEPKIRLIADRLFVRECGIIERILTEGKKAGEVLVADLKKTAKLYVTILKGLSHVAVCRLSPTTNMGMIDNELLAKMVQIRKEAVKLMLQGILVNNTETV